jgi:hypothetical protein
MKNKGFYFMVRNFRVLMLIKKQLRTLINKNENYKCWRKERSRRRNEIYITILFV